MRTRAVSEAWWNDGCRYPPANRSRWKDGKEGWAGQEGCAYGA